MKTKITNFFKKSLRSDLLILLIITVPAFIRLFNQGYFPMHDDQHIVRLFLFDQGVRQGVAYPRWVDGLGFGFGYPLFNFYPPFIYFVGFLFHLVGFSYIWSIKLVFIAGFIGAAVGIYLLTKSVFGRISGILAATFYTYFFYHAVVPYVRGALAEFISLAVLPFVLHSLVLLSKKANFKQSVYFAFSFAILILSQPLIALPAVFYIGVFILFLLWKQETIQKKISFFKWSAFGGLTGLALSIFFWLPSLFEKNFTLVDNILTKELANYTRHFIVPSQFIYSPWGYGGSGEGIADGMTFQLGKVHIFFAVVSFILFIYSLVKVKKDKNYSYFAFFVILLLFSVFMTTSLSSFIWDNVSALWYLQFPWRYLTFVALFISLVGGSVIYFLQKYVKPSYITLFTAVIIVATIFIYQKYFTPQHFYNTNDTEKTSLEEVSWRISSTSYEFVPKGVQTKIVDNHSVLDISKNEVTDVPYAVMSENASVQQLENKYHRQTFAVNSRSSIIFRLNVYNFPGWKAYIERNGKREELTINDNNKLKLITVNVPAGESSLLFQFEDTSVRTVANTVSLVSILGLLLAVVYIKFRKLTS